MKELHGIDNNETITEFWYNLRNSKDGLDQGVKHASHMHSPTYYMRPAAYCTTNNPNLNNFQSGLQYK